MLDNESPLPFMMLLFVTGIILVYVLKMRNPRITTVIITPLFLFLVAAILGTTQLYLMGSALLSMAAVSYLLAAFSLRGVHVSRKVTTPVTRGDWVTISVVVANRHRLPKFFLRARCVLPPWLRAEQDTVVVPGLWPGQSTTVRLQAHALKRGCYLLPPVKLVGADPLDLFQRAMLVGEPVEVVVYPVPEGAYALELLGADLFGLLAARRVIRPGEGLDFHGLRDYRHGDDLRAIDWKATARFSRLIAVEFEPTQIGDLVLLLDNRIGVHAGQGSSSTLERAVSAAAGAVASILSMGGGVHLRYFGVNGAMDLFRRGGSSDIFLDALARVDLAPGKLSDLPPADLSGCAVLLVTPDSSPASIAAVHQAIAAGGRALVLLLDAGQSGLSGSLRDGFVPDWGEREPAKPWLDPYARTGNTASQHSGGLIHEKLTAFLEFIGFVDEEPDTDARGKDKASQQSGEPTRDLVNAFLRFIGVIDERPDKDSVARGVDKAPKQSRGLVREWLTAFYRFAGLVFDESDVDMPELKEDLPGGMKTRGMPVEAAAGALRAAGAQVLVVQCPGQEGDGIEAGEAPAAYPVRSR